MPMLSVTWVCLCISFGVGKMGNSLACAEWQRRMPVEQSWAKFKICFSNAHRDHRLVSQTALRSGYYAVNMFVQAPVGHLPRSSNFSDFNHKAHMTNADQCPNIATGLTKFSTATATATGSERTPVVALTKAISELTAFTQSQDA
jgi:hypothetical protein